MFLLAFSFSAVFKADAQSLRTVTFTGNISDFNATEERIAAADANNVVYAITYDATHLYVGAFRTSGTFGSSDNFSVFLDTDPQALAAGNGTAAIYNFNGVTGTTPFRTDYAFRVEQSYEEYRTATPGWSANLAIPGGNVFTNSTCRELRIPLSLIGNPRAVYATFWMGFAGGQFANAPGADLPDGNNPTVTNYFGGFGLTSAGCRPINVRNRVLTAASLTSGIPVSGGVYGYVESSVTQNFNNPFTIAAGGSLVHTANTLTISNTVTLGNESTNFPLVSNGVTLNRTGGTFVGTSCNVTTVGGAATINGTWSINNLTANGGVNLTSGTTVTGTLQINANGFISGNPTYGASSTLQYGTGGAYGPGDEWSVGDGVPGIGRPNNVVVQTGTTLNMPNTSRGAGGALTIQTGSTLNLSATIGADLFIKGNFTQSGTFSTNNRAVFFTGSGTQTIGGTSPVTFNFLGIQKTAASTVQLSAVDVVINANSNDVLQFLGANVGTLDLNGRALTLTNDGGTIFCSGANHVITNSNATASTINIAGNKFIADDGSGSRQFTIGNVSAARTINIAITQGKTLTVGNGSDVTLLFGSGSNGITTNIQNVAGSGTIGTLAVSSGANLQVNGNATFGLDAVNPARINIAGLFVSNGGTTTFNQGDISASTNAGTFVLSTGIVRRTAAATLNSSATTLSFEASSTYQHNTSASAIPFATWASTSNCVLQNTGTGAMTNANFEQTFGNFVYNSTQTMNLTNHASGTITMNVAGNFTHQNSGQLTLHNAATGILNVNVSGNLLMAATANGAILRQESNGTGTCNLSVTGNLTLNRGTLTNTNPGTLSVGGNVLIEGSPAASQTTWTYGAATKSFAGNFTVNTTTGTFGFTPGTGAYTFTGTNRTIGGNRDFAITNATITGTYTNDNSSANGLSIGILTVDGASATFTNAANRTLQLILGSDPVVLLNGGTVDFDNADNTVNYNVNAAQNVFVTNYYNLAVNQNTKTLNGDITVNGNLSGSATFVISGTNTLTLLGNFAQSGTFTPNTSTVNFARVSGNQVVRGTTYYNLTISGGGTKTMGAAVVIGSATVPSTFTPTAGELVMNGFALTLNCSIGSGSGTIRANAAPASAPNITLGPVTTAQSTSAGTLNFSPGFQNIGTLAFSRNMSGVTGNVTREAVTLGNSLIVNAFSFANNTGFVRLLDNSDFTVLSSTALATTLNVANMGTLRYFALGQNSSVVFNPPTVAIPSAATLIYQVGMSSTSGLTNVASNIARGTLGATIASTSITGVNTNFDQDLALGEELQLTDGTVLGVITAIASATSLTIDVPATVIGASLFRKKRFYMPVTLIPNANSAIGASLAVSFKNHSGGGLANSTNVPSAVPFRRSSFILDVTTSAGFPNTDVRSEVKFSEDFNASIDLADGSFFRWDGLFWAKIPPQSIVPGALGNRRLERSSVTMFSGTNSFVIGQTTPGGLPDVPTFVWTGGAGNSQWKNVNNWNRTPENAGDWPNDPTHNVTINASGSGSPVISSGDSIIVASIIQTAKSLTVSGGGILALDGNYILNPPTQLPGTGTLALSGTTVTGSGTAFTTQLQIGSMLFKTDGTVIGMVRQINGDEELLVQNVGAYNPTTLNAGTSFNYIFNSVSTPSGSPIITTITTSANNITGGPFTNNMVGRGVISGGQYIGMIAAVVSSTNLLFVSNPTQNLVDAPFELTGAINPVGSGNLICSANSTINYLGERDQVLAVPNAGYHNLGLFDNRTTAPTSPFIKFVTTTGRTITVRGTMKTKFYSAPSSVNGPYFVINNGGGLSVFAPTYSNGNGFQVFRNFASLGIFNSTNLKVGPTSAARIDLHVRSVSSGSGGHNLDGCIRSLLPNIRNLYIQAASGSSGSRWIIDDSDTVSVSGEFVVAGPSLATPEVGGYTPTLQLGVTDNAPAARLRLAGNISGFTRIGRGGSGGLGRPSFHIVGSGTITNTNFDLAYSGAGNVPCLINFTLDRVGATINLNNAVSSQHFVAGNVMKILNGTLSRPAGGDVSAFNSLVLGGTGAIVKGGTGSVGTVVPTTSLLLMSGNSAITHTGSGNVGCAGAIQLVGNPTWNLSSNTATGSAFGAGTNFTMAGGTLNMPPNGDFFTIGAFTQNGGTINKAGGNFILHGDVVINGGTRNNNLANIAFIPTTVLTIPLPGPSGLQTFSSSSNRIWEFNDLVIEKTSGNVVVAANTRLKIRGTLNVISNSTVTATGNIILGGSPGGSARVAQLPSISSTSQLLGTNWTVEKYINSGTTAGFHFLGTSIQGQTVSDWGDDFAINTPLVAPATTTVAANRTNFFAFDGTTPDGPNTNEKNGWRVPTTVNVVHGKGYRGFLNAQFFGGSRIIDNTGAITHGDFNFNAVHNPAGYVGNSGPGWNLVANPYPSTIDWSVSNGSGWTRSNMLQTYWIWNKQAGSGGAYATFTAGSPSGINGATRYIPANQGFFVIANPSPNFLSDERVKADQNPTFLRTVAEEYTNAFLVAFSDASGQMRDETVLYERADASDNFDASWDGPKMNNPSINVSTISTDGRRLAINAFGTINAFKVIKTAIEVPREGTYKLEFNFLGEIGQNVRVYLRDNYQGWLEPITSTGTEYSFAVTADPASKGDDRFEIVFGYDQITTLLPTNQEAFRVYPNPSNGGEIHIAAQHVENGNVHVTMFDLRGKEVFSQVVNANGRKLNAIIKPELLPGVYSMVIKGGNTKTTIKHIVR